MKKNCLLAVLVALALTLSACGTQSDNKGNTDDKPSTPAPSNSTPAENTPASGDSVTDDFLKTITAETAEFKGACGADLTWYYQDNVLVIKGTGEMTDYNGSGSGQAPWGKGREDKLYGQINWVIIDEGVTSIGKNAFSNCNKISKVVLPSTLEKIGDSAFWECNELASITIPASVSYIGGGAFIYCNDPLSITFLGDASELAPNEQIFEGWALTVYYSGSGFDAWQEMDSRINLVKQ